MKRKYISPEFCLGEQILEEALLDTSSREANSADMGYQEDGSVIWTY